MNQITEPKSPKRVTRIRLDPSYIRRAKLNTTVTHKNYDDIQSNFERRRHEMKLSSDVKNEDYDEGLGDSEIGDASSSNDYHSSQVIHSDQSEDSSLTDSERTLVGDELSPRNNSPDIMGTEVDQDLEPLHSGVEVLKPECDAMLGTSEVFCPVHGQEESRNMSSPEENTKDTNCSTNDCKSMCTCPKSQTVPESPPKRHFRGYTYFDCETNEKSMYLFIFLLFCLNNA